MNGLVGALIKKIVLWIDSVSKESIKKKDMLTCLVFIEFTIVMGVTLPLTQQIFNIMGETIEKIIQMIDYMNQGNLPAFIANNISYDLNLKNDIKIFFYVTLTMVPFLILQKTKKGTVILIYIASQILLSFFFFKDVGKFVFFLVVLLFCINIYIPFGSGAYFNIIKYASYIPSIYQPEIFINQKKIMTMLIKIVLGGIAFMLALKWLVPSFTAYMLGLLFISMILLIWINNSKNKVQIIIRKILMYSLIVPFVLLNNNTFNSDIQSTVLVLVSIFFSIDRVVALFKELKKIIEENSLLFLLDEIEDQERLWKNKIDFSERERIEISEQLLLRQIIIYFKLSLTDINNLIKLYKDSGYTEELHLVRSIEYFTVVDEETSLEEREFLLIQIFKDENEGTVFLPLLEEYAWVLFYFEKGYDEIVQMLIEHWLYLSDKTKYILYYACQQTNDLVAAETIKREIADFNSIELEMKEEYEIT